MTSDEPDDGRSLSGAPIFRHRPPGEADVSPPASPRFLDAIDAHLTAHLGGVTSVFHEVRSAYVHVDVHHIAPTKERPVHLLVTSGMSDRPMHPPPDAKACTHAELLVALPRSWPVSERGLEDPARYWPVGLLKLLARFPHALRTFLWSGHTVPNGDPPAPYDESTAQCAALLLPPVGLPAPFWELEAPSGERIHFFQVIPLYKDELELKLRDGLGALLDRFARDGLPEVIDPERPSACRRW